MTQATSPQKVTKAKSRKVATPVVNVKPVVEPVVTPLVVEPVVTPLVVEPVAPKRVVPKSAVPKRVVPKSAVPKRVVPKSVVETKTAKEDEAPGKEKKRVFTVLYVRCQGSGEESEFKGGKYSSKTPAGAARKSANQACKILYNETDCEIEISIKETTKNGSSKEYTYKASRSLSKKQVEFKGSDGKVPIPFKYSMTLKSLKKSPTGEIVATAVAPSELDTVDESVV